MVRVRASVLIQSGILFNPALLHFAHPTYATCKKHRPNSTYFPNLLRRALPSSTPPSGLPRLPSRCCDRNTCCHLSSRTATRRKVTSNAHRQLSQPGNRRTKIARNFHRPSNAKWKTSPTSSVHRRLPVIVRRLLAHSERWQRKILTDKKRRQAASCLCCCLLCNCEDNIARKCENNKQTSARYWGK